MASGVNPRPDRVPEHDLLTPRNLVSMAAARRYFLWKMIDHFRVFVSGGINRRKYDGQRRPRGPPTW